MALTSGSANNDYLDDQKSIGKGHRSWLKGFIICLAISMVMWLMIRLSRDYTQTIRFLVFYKGIKNNSVLLPNTDTTLFVNYQASGYNIIYNRLFHNNYHVEIDISKYQQKLVKDYFEIGITTFSLENEILRLFKNKVKVKSISPATLKVRLGKAHFKKVPVEADIKISFAKQHDLYNKIHIYPDTVIITGSSRVIDTIMKVRTESKILSEIASNYSLTLKLINPLNKNSLRISHENVRVFIPVAKFTENHVEVPITLDTLPESYQLITYPEKVSVYFNVSIPDYEKVVSDSFKVGFNELKLLELESNIARVEIKKYPSFVRFQRIEPENVEFLIRKK